MIDLDNWRFGTLAFSSAEAFCEHLSINGRQYQRRIETYLHTNPIYQHWKRTSHPIKNLSFYGRYRKSEQSKKFHASAQAVASGEGTDTDRERLAGLTREIVQSPVVLKPGQKLFHGRYLDFSQTVFPSSYFIPSFLSCTLCPEVAIWHALSKAGQYSIDANAAVFIITLATDCPALFGAKGKLDHEQELLLPPAQTLSLTASTIIPTGHFNIVHANLAYSP